MQNDSRVYRSISNRSEVGIAAWKQRIIGSYQEEYRCVYTYMLLTLQNGLQH